MTINKHSCKNAFTLLELLAVMAIVAVLATVLTVAVKKSMRSVKMQNARELALQYSTALNLLSARGGSWTGSLIGASKKADPILDDQACKSLASIGVSIVRSGSTLKGSDRCGLADPWAQEVINHTSTKVAKKDLLKKSVGTGGTVEDHLYRFAIAIEDENRVIAQIGGKKHIINGTRAAVWGFGADGVPDTEDDIMSWNKQDEELEMDK